MQAKFVTAVLLGFVLIGASACGGGGGLNGGADPDGKALTLAELTAGKIVAPGTYHLDDDEDAEAFLEAFDDVKQPVGGYAPGSPKISVPGLDLRCAQDSATNCSVTLNDDDSFTTTGTIVTVAAGGTFMTPGEKLIAEANQRADEAEAAEEDTDAEEETDADEVARLKKEAEDAKNEAEQAKQDAAKARQEAEQAKQDAETQADASVRATALRTVLENVSSTREPAASDMVVSHMRGDRLTFGRPNALPTKGSAPSVPGSWRSASYGGPRGSVGTDTVYVYTNIQSPSSKAFWKVHGEKVETITEADATVSGFGTAEKTLLTENSAGKVTANGTYNGYSGKFMCESGCNIATAAGTEDLTFTGDWEFAASLTAKRTSKKAEQDSEFLYFGIWVFEPTDPADTDNPHTFNWAAGGDADDIPDPNFSALTGEATFTGGAIGKYALAKATGRGARAAKTGTFTAKANFTAVFGAAPKLSGRITDFKEGGTNLGSDWNIFLGETSSTAATLSAASASGTTHGAIDGDTVTTGGTWNATLHGSGNNTTLDRDKYPASNYPVADVAGVAGWFKAAAGTNAAIAGAFGAACTTGTMCAK